MKHIIFLLSLLGCTTQLMACNSDSNSNERPVPEVKPALTIQWDASTLVCITEGGGYARMHRLKDNRLMIVYEDYSGNTQQRYSSDNGKTWSLAKPVVSAFYVDDEKETKVKVRIANPEFIQLANGDLLFGCNLRPEREGIFPFTIAICRSTNLGETWSEPDRIYAAATRFSDGCWEPSFLQLPDGKVQVYFANEGHFLGSNEQEISLMESVDNGVTWSNDRRVCFRANFRDGMPVATLGDGNIYLAIEDNGRDQFKPFIVQTSITDNWKTPVLADSPNRKNALKETLPDAVYAGAPYLIRTKDYYALSYQTNRGRTTDWEKSTMEVVVSKSPMEPMIGVTYPFNVPLDREAKWNSLTDMGDNRVAAIASTNFQNTQVGIWMIQGTIVINE